ncbi:SRPBCC domain-containing protein [Flavobacterium sp. XGLA_31]|uniref:SRPBCC domain-containing protein n=1 Tax=Flavobacterium sp. XGLA_31 TaxID=3447666 RepID=UPI003F408134
MSTIESSTANREIIVTRLLPSPVTHVWEVWTNPDHIKQWWGPNGFTNTITQMDVIPDGVWKLIMHGPDGTDYDNESRFTEVVPYQKIAYNHLSGHEFTATILFEERGMQTHMHWQMLFESKEELDRILSLYDIREGLNQNADRLQTYITNLTN